MDWLGIILLYLMISTFLGIFVLWNYRGDGSIICLPREFHRVTYMNWFLCILVSIIILILFPFIWLINLVFSFIGV